MKLEPVQETPSPEYPARKAQRSSLLRTVKLAVALASAATTLAFGLVGETQERRLPGRPPAQVRLGGEAPAVDNIKPPPPPILVIPQPVNVPPKPQPPVRPPGSMAPVRR